MSGKVAASSGEEMLAACFAERNQMLAAKAAGKGGKGGKQL